MEGKSLEQVIESSNGDIALALDEYFGTSSAARSKSVLTKEAINILLNKVRKCPEFLPWVVRCFDDFISNQEMQQEWLIHCKELSQLWSACLDNSETSEVHTRNIYRILTILGKKGEPLSSTLFNMCAERLFELVDGSTGQIRSNSLEVLNTLCWCSERSNIAETFELEAYQLDKLAAMSFSLSIEAQVNVYLILTKAICSKQDAAAKASLWFDGWPKVQLAFTNYYPDECAEGCGEFLHELRGLSEEEENFTNLSKESRLQTLQRLPNPPFTNIEESGNDITSDASECFSGNLGKEPGLESVQFKSETDCTTIDNSGIDIAADASVDILETFKNSGPRVPRFTLRTSFPKLTKAPLEIGANEAFPVMSAKRRVASYVDNKWFLHVKKYSEVSNKERWPSFKWRSGKRLI